MEEETISAKDVALGSLMHHIQHVHTPAVYRKLSELYVTLAEDGDSGWYNNRNELAYSCFVYATELEAES